VPEIQGTTQEVAIEKCRRAAELVIISPFFPFPSQLYADSSKNDPLVQIGGPVITEDTALCFAAMNGLPGPFIKFFLRDLGHEGT
jgi:inosine triphosphate pyrophosphatase